MTACKPFIPALRLLSAALSACLMAGSIFAAPAVAEEPVAKKEAAKEKPAPPKEPAAKEKTAPAKETTPPAAKETKPATAAPTTTEKPTAPAATDTPEAPAAVDPDDEAAAENQDAEAAAVAKPVTADPIQIYGWREHILIKGVAEKLQAKLDTGALTSSIHAEEKELFERDGKKWVRFIVTDPSQKKPTRTRIEAPLVRMALIKEPNGPSVAREVVKLSFQIGERKMNGEFTLNNRSNMLAPVLIGRKKIKDLGWVDPGRTHLAEQKIFR